MCLHILRENMEGKRSYRAATWDLKNDIKVTGISLYQEVVQNIYYAAFC